jgi:hypothetical protein
MFVSVLRAAGGRYVPLDDVAQHEQLLQVMKQGPRLNGFPGREAYVSGAALFDDCVPIPWSCGL